LEFSFFSAEAAKADLKSGGKLLRGTARARKYRLQLLKDFRAKNAI
jgi:hypothetical protein